MLLCVRDSDIMCSGHMFQTIMINKEPYKAYISYLNMYEVLLTIPQTSKLEGIRSNTDQLHFSR